MLKPKEKDTENEGIEDVHPDFEGKALVSKDVDFERAEGLTRSRHSGFDVVDVCERSVENRSQVLELINKRHCAGAHGDGGEIRVTNSLLREVLLLSKPIAGGGLTDVSVEV